jgi:hypothetical protein
VSLQLLCLLLPIAITLVKRSPNRSFTWLLLVILSLPKSAHSQDSLLNSKRIDSFSKSLKLFDARAVEEKFTQFKPHSSVRKKMVQALTPDTNGLAASLSYFKNSLPAFSSKPFLRIGSGYVSYNWDYRSGIDSSVAWNNISQQLVTTSFNAVLAQTIPVRITYLERHSNSVYFKDFRDVRVDVDVQQYRQLRLQKALRGFSDYSEKLRDPLVLFALQAAKTKTNQFRNLLGDPAITRELIHAKETIARKDLPDTSSHYRDSVLTKARQFIELYDTLQAGLHRYERLADSLQEVYQQSEKKIRRTKQLLSGKPLSTAEVDELSALYGRNDKRVRQIRQAYSGLRTFSLGRTLPNFSSLTLQNVNVNGINLEYSRNNIYAAVAAGMVDFRIRDFLYSNQQPVKQYVYSGRLGYGTREGDHVIVTYFRGRKQLFGGATQRTASEIQGVSLAAQYFVYKGVRVYGEVAQSGVPYTFGNTATASNKPSLRLSDPSQRAYALGFASYIPRTQTTATGHYQYNGINYQSFNSFQYNAAANSWAFGLTQPFWKQQLTLRAAFRKNDFTNPLIPQRYNSNTVFKNVTLTFSKNKWPLISVGYLPASQYTAVGNQVYENHYQSFTATVNYQYSIGSVKASSLMTMSRFFNDSRDSGFVYYNSRNFFWNQTILFRLFTATLSVSGMANGVDNLLVMEEGVSATFFKKVNAGFAIKINNLNKTTTKLGFNANTRVDVKYVGEINLWMEQSYLPSLQSGLFRYESYNIGLTRYF